MSFEVSLMRWFIDPSYDHARVSLLVLYIVDNFRINAFQEDLDFARLESKAQTAIERCNRTCHSMQSVHKAYDCRKNHGVYEALFAEAMPEPRVGGLHGLQLLHAGRAQPLLKLEEVHDLQSSVVRWALPVELQQQQYELIRAAELSSGMQGIKHRTLLCICMRCQEKHPTTSGNMRLVHGQASLCIHCASNTFTVCVQTLGCIVRIKHDSYYFCRFCCGVHAWNGNGVFQVCPAARETPHSRLSRLRGVLPRPGSLARLCLRPEAGRAKRGIEAHS
jgi:hypothetical protein